MKPKFYLITSFSNEVEVEVQRSAYCPKGQIYFMPDRNRPILNHLKSLYEAEKERNEWIRRYENVLNGLHYWRQLALNQSSDK